MVNVIPQTYDGIILSHLGEKTGEIMIEMHVKLPDNNNMETPPHSFDLISIGYLEDVTRRGSVRSPQVPHRKSFVPQRDSLTLPEKTVNRTEENPPAIPKRHSASQPDTAKGSRDPPPPLPAKTSKPRTVEEMMRRIGFSQYTNSLLAYGWDDLEFLGDLTEDDLSEAGVPIDHHRMILAAIKRFAH
ncbi:Inositol polyphosphate phosphatase-like 1a [Desmophyllum pertusum]|uniref:Inositol polyphosphate phosphatase-like 1a n=1 Tax=Desmophyllum pertusum TaxID=174260 RepID=A0A9X0D0N4_9CNID|nr:Inositol polyphosphate phosphatase-like 1a [Desmophyllum pertusum]